MESILITIKKLLGIVESCTDFDEILITHINSVFSNLHQLGVGPKEGYAISSSADRWEDYVVENQNLLRNIRTYMYQKVKLMFDPPQNSALLESINRQIAEQEWRINTCVEHKESNNVG